MQRFSFQFTPEVSTKYLCALFEQKSTNPFSLRTLWTSVFIHSKSPTLNCLSRKLLFYVWNRLNFIAFVQFREIPWHFYSGSWSPGNFVLVLLLLVAAGQSLPLKVTKSEADLPQTWLDFLSTWKHKIHVTCGNISTKRRQEITNWPQNL